MAMKSSIEEFVVVLDDPDRVYSPGQHVHGKVILNSKQPVKIHKLFLECNGEAYVCWPEGSGTYTRYRYNKQEYYHLKSCLYDQESSSQDICSSYEFSFRFTIPYQDLPPSYESAHGYIRYSISAKIQKKGKTKFKTEKTLFNIGNYQEYDKKELEEIKNSEQTVRNGKDQTTVLGRRCYPIGMVNLSAYTDKILYQDGETIKTEIHIDRQQKIERIDVALVRVTKYSDSHGHSTCYADKLVCIDKELVQDPSEDPTIKLKLPIPHDIYPTLQFGCKCICIYYHIEVRLRPKNKLCKEPYIKIPIIISTTTGSEIATDQASTSESRSSSKSIASSSLTTCGFMDESTTDEGDETQL
ncbi:arrestin domain-containing protein 17 isoform X2 [Exaiptasia diaphana]|uniref:Arrestin C-terminal-like domain-containing protein n=1 Tax=Exaiptasia diaphana TaxID=2652724 RepID=A0A913X1Y0_EXADI|nr:arrestin domain-containing protein 17 isoform X2 [Exaiptasia diaphana]